MSCPGLQPSIQSNGEQRWPAATGLRFRRLSSSNCVCGSPARTIRGAADLGKGFAQVFAARMREADEYYETLRPPGASDGRNSATERVKRSRGRIGSEQFYHYRVWCAGSRAIPPIFASQALAGPTAQQFRLPH